MESINTKNLISEIRGQMAQWNMGYWTIHQYQLYAKYSHEISFKFYPILKDKTIGEKTTDNIITFYLHYTLNINVYLFCIYLFVYIFM